MQQNDELHMMSSFSAKINDQSMSGNGRKCFIVGAFRLDVVSGEYLTRSDLAKSPFI
jgi:hypothetical protein